MTKRYKTGFCGTGCHEGTKPKSPSGKPMKTCEFWQDCSCSCHVLVTKMFAEADMPRIPVPNPEYVPEKSTYVMPERVVVDAPPVLSSPALVIPPNAMVTPAPGTVAPATVRSFAPTITGRAARGELEAWVKAKCDEWLVEEYDFPCTPNWISEQIAESEGIKPPSTGAITAALDKWVRIGFAVVERKPVRFIRYTEAGLEHGLDGMKDRAKRKVRV